MLIMIFKTFFFKKNCWKSKNNPEFEKDFFFHSVIRTTWWAYPAGITLFWKYSKINSLSVYCNLLAEHTESLNEGELYMFLYLKKKTNDTNQNWYELKLWL